MGPPVIFFALDYHDQVASEPTSSSCAIVGATALGTCARAPSRVAEQLRRVLRQQLGRGQRGPASVTTSHDYVFLRCRWRNRSPGEDVTGLQPGCGATSSIKKAERPVYREVTSRG